MKTHSICILCEGYEEYDYLTKLINLNIFHPTYLNDLINVKSINNLYPRYIEKFTQNSYHLVIIFCDTDKPSMPAYKTLKENINAFHNISISNQIVFFGNPCTMQIILSHFKAIKLKNPSKKHNSKLIEKLTLIKDYKATNDQRKKLFQLINRDNYKQMKKTLQLISTNDKDIPSTNFLILLTNLENKDSKWIDEINNLL